MSIFKGCATALVTPFTADGTEINYTSLKNIIEYQIENGVSALVVLGTTGESTTISHEERNELIKFTIKEVGHRVPVIVGAGSNNTKDAIQKSIECEQLGADAILSVTPYYNKSTQRGLIEHFTRIANSVKIPIILYNVPGRTGVNILPNTVYKLSQIPNIVAIKEASGAMEQISEIIRLCDSSFDVYSGDDGLIVPIMSMGGLGVISVASNPAPKLISEICSDCLNQDFNSAKQKQLQANPLIKTLFCEVNPIPVKTAMNLLGFNAGVPRLPLTPMEENNIESLSAELKSLGLLT